MNTPDTNHKPDPWHTNPVITAIIGSLLTGMLSLVMFSFTRGVVENSTVISGNSAKIADLENKLTTLEARQTSYITQQTFEEFKARYEQDQLKLQATDARIENKLDVLLMEHAKPVKPGVQTESMR